MYFKSSTKHILNDSPSPGNDERYLGTCKIQASGLNGHHAVINANVHNPVCINPGINLWHKTMHTEDPWEGQMQLLTCIISFLIFLSNYVIQKGIHIKDTNNIKVYKAKCEGRLECPLLRTSASFPMGLLPTELTNPNHGTQAVDPLSVLLFTYRPAST